MDLNEIRRNLSLGVPLTKLKLKVTYYSRVSTNHVDQQNSLQNQISFFEDMIENNTNWILEPGYVDEGITGTSILKRTNFLHMINDAKLGKFNLILTKEISRFSRNTLDSIKYTRELLNNGVAVLFVNDNINTALPDSELRLTIMASLAQDEIRRLSERVKFGMQRAIKNGVILGHNMLYGYRKDSNTGNLIINNQEALVVQKIFYLYGIENYSLAKIVKYLNNLNIKTNHNNKWCSSTVMRMLKNPKYKGFYCGRKTEIVDYMTKKEVLLSQEKWLIYKDFKKIPPIIEEPLWDKVNERLKLISHKRINTSRYALSLKIICINDKKYYHCRKLNNGERVWSCSKYLTEGKSKCHAPHLRENELYTILDDYFKKLKINYQQIEKILIDIYNQYNIQTNDYNEIKKESKKVNDTKQKWIELFVNNLITRDDFNQNITQCNNKLKELDIKIREINYKNDLPKQTYCMHKLLNDKTIFRDTLIKLLINKIVVSMIDKNQIRLDIYSIINSSNNEQKYTFKKSNNGGENTIYIVNFYYCPLKAKML